MLCKVDTVLIYPNEIDGRKIFIGLQAVVLLVAWS